MAAVTEQSPGARARRPGWLCLCRLSRVGQRGVTQRSSWALLTCFAFALDLLSHLQDGAARPGLTPSLTPDPSGPSFLHFPFSKSGLLRYTFLIVKLAPSIKVNTCVQSCSHHHIKINTDQVPLPRRSSCPSQSLPPHYSPWQPLLFFVPVILPFPEYHINGLIKYV